MTYLTGTVAVIAVLISLFSLWQSHRAIKATVKVSEIEIDRRWEELTPQFEVKASLTGTDSGKFQMKLVGPKGLDRLDSMTLKVSEFASTPPPTEYENKQEYLESLVWSRFRFPNGIEGYSSHGKEAHRRQIQMGETLVFDAELTTRPAWLEKSVWERSEGFMTFSFTAVCEREGQKPWTIPFEVTGLVISLYSI